MIKLLPKPTYPKRLTINIKHIIHDGDNVLAVLNKIPSDYQEDAYFESEYEGGYGYGDPGTYRWYICCSYPEHEEDYNKRVKQYEIDLEDYNKWEKDNAAAILEIKQSSKNKQLDKIRKEKKQLEKQLNTLSKKERYLLERNK